MTTEKSLEKESFKKRLAGEPNLHDLQAKLEKLHQQKEELKELNDKFLKSKKSVADKKAAVQQAEADVDQYFKQLKGEKIVDADEEQSNAMFRSLVGIMPVASGQNLSGMSPAQQIAMQNALYQQQSDLARQQLDAAQRQQQASQAASGLAGALAGPWFGK